MLRIIFIFGVIVTVCISAQAQPADINNGLVTYFSFDDDAEDLSGQRNTGTLKGAEQVNGRFKGAVRFDGEDVMITKQQFQAPDVFTVALWFKAESGGFLIGFEKSQVKPSQAHDRQLYMGDDGRLHFRVYLVGSQLVSTSRSYNDEQWHHVAATLSQSGMSLYVNGELAAHDAGTTSGFPYLGYWRIGEGTFSGWTGRPTNPHFTGVIDDVRIYNRALDETAVRALYAYNPSITPREKVDQIVTAGMQQWSQRGKFEKVEEYEARVNEDTRAAVEDSLTQQALMQVGEERIDWSTARNKYDPDTEEFTIMVEHLEPFNLAVPIGEAEALDASFSQLQYLNPVYALGDGDGLEVAYVEVTNPSSGKTYVYDNKKEKSEEE